MNPHHSPSIIINILPIWFNLSPQIYCFCFFLEYFKAKPRHHAIILKNYLVRPDLVAQLVRASS